MDCSLPGSSVRGILQARIREWVAISWPTCWTDFTPMVLLKWWHLNHLGSLSRSSSCQSPPSWLPCPVGWGEAGEASVGKTSLGVGGTSHCSCRAVWGCWLGNSGSGSQDVGTVKTLNCFIHLSAEVATTDLWARQLWFSCNKPNNFWFTYCVLAPG